MNDNKKIEKTVLWFYFFILVILRLLGFSVYICSNKIQTITVNNHSKYLSDYIKW